MIVKLLTEHNLEFLSVIGGCRGSSEYTRVKMRPCWKPHATAHMLLTLHNQQSRSSFLHAQFQVKLKLQRRMLSKSAWSIQTPREKT